MRTIKISDEDYEFLKDLQHELNTQENDGNADPVYWGVMEIKEKQVPEGCGEERILIEDGDYFTLDLEQAADWIRESADEQEMEAWNELCEIEQGDFCIVLNFIQETMGRKARVIYVDDVEELSRETGCFLTKRECKRYVNTYAYNHSRPHTYAMTAYRNFELERLLKILKTMEIKED